MKKIFCSLVTCTCIQEILSFASVKQNLCVKFIFSLLCIVFKYLFCFLGPEVPDFLQYRVTRQKQNSDAIEDIFDGQLYKKHFGEDGFFRGSSTQDKKTQIHLSLQINTDGVAIFRSSKFSIWPVYFIVNELPPNCRYVIKAWIFTLD